MAADHPFRREMPEPVGQLIRCDHSRACWKVPAWA